MLFYIRWSQNFVNDFCNEHKQISSHLPRSPYKFPSQLWSSCPCFSCQTSSVLSFCSLNTKYAKSDNGIQTSQTKMYSLFARIQWGNTFFIRLGYGSATLVFGIMKKIKFRKWITLIIFIRFQNLNKMHIGNNEKSIFLKKCHHSLWRLVNVPSFIVLWFRFVSNFPIWFWIN